MQANVIAELCLYIITWNVGTHHPQDQSLTNLLSLNMTSDCPDGSLPDLYAIAFQEVDASASTQFKGLFQDDAWTFKVADYLSAYDYVKIETKQMQGLLLMIFAQTKHISHINDIETEKTATGIGDLWGNKGGVSVRMSLYGPGVTFVAAHLAAHDGELKKRIKDYNQIINKHHYTIPKYRNIYDHDIVFWFGDLNFRLTGDDSAFDIQTAVEQNRLSELFERDQLKLVRETGNAFSLMEEQVPSFPPTFKFIEGTSDYHLKRRPAWCDRILHRVQASKYPDIKINLQQLSYKSYPEYVLSDHKPVSASFLFKLESDTMTDNEIYERTHSGSGSVLASVIIIFLSVAVNTLA